MPRGYYSRGTEEDRRAQRARGMEAFDRAAAADERNSVANERLDMQRSHQDWSEAFRQAQEDARIAQKADSLSVRERGMAIREQASELDKKAFDLQQSQRAAQLAETNRKLETAKKITDDTAGYFNSIAGLDPHMPEYRSRIDAITKQFPAALQAEGPQKHYSGTMAVHDKWLAEQAKAPPRAVVGGALVERNPETGAWETKVESKAVPPALLTEANRLDKEYFTEVAAWQKFKKDNPDKAAPNEATIADLRAKRDEIGVQIHSLNNPAPSATQAPTTKGRVVVNPKTGERLTEQNGQWVPLTP